MQSILILSMLIGVSLAVDMSNSNEVCSKQSQINLLIKQLTPSGQNATLSILKDVQTLSGAAYQIILNKVRTQNQQSFNRLVVADPTNAKNLNDLFENYKNANDLIDMCKAKKAEEDLVNSFKDKNQASAKYIIKQINDRYSSVLTSLATIVQTLNSDLVSQLMKNENMSLLTSLAKLL